MNLSVVTPPAVEPVSLVEAKAHLRVDHADEDALITDLIVAAREWCEQASGRAFVTQTLLLGLESFPACPIELPRPPAASVTSIQYLDPDGADLTLDSSKYYPDISDEPARVHPAYGQTWPAARCFPNSVRITYVAGYGAAAVVPRRAKQAIKLLVGHWYQHREEVSTERTPAKVQTAAQDLLAQLWHGRIRG